MQRRIRKIILFVAGVLFTATAPLVILYAIGYRAAPGEIPQAVGVLLVDALPSKTSVAVAGENVGRVPKSVANLSPGQVIVKLSKPGYVPWQKTVAIEPARATEIRGVRLWPEQPDRLLLHTDSILFSLSPNRKLLAAVNGLRELSIQSADGQETVVPGQKLGQRPISLSWSADNNLVLVGYQGARYDLIDVSNPGTEPRALPLLSGAQDVEWDLRLPGRLFALLPTGSLVSYNAASDFHTILLDGVQRFAVSARNIFAVRQPGVISVYSRQGQLVQDLRSASIGGVQEILPEPSGRVGILSLDGNVSVFDKAGKETPIAGHVLAAAWSPDGKMLMIQPNHNELYVYNAAREGFDVIPLAELRLVVRLSRTIAQPQWYAGGQHVIYQVGDEIVISEIDTRDYAISYTVDSTNLGDAQVAVGEDGDVIYYLKSGGQTGLYAAAMLTPS